MKNYEILSLLSDLPAGYEVEVVQSCEFGKDKLDDDNMITMIGNVADIDISYSSKTITLLT